MRHHLLFHNIGHHDFYLLIQKDENAEQIVTDEQTNETTETNETIQKIAVPINVHMRSISKFVYEQLKEKQITIRGDENRTDIVWFSEGINTYDIRYKQVLQRRIKFSLGKNTQIVGLVFPILAPVVQKLLQKFPESEQSYFVQLLTTGDENNDDTRDLGRSTLYIGKILQNISTTVFPQVTFTHRHNESEDDFSFKGRPKFFRKDVIPYIHEIRQKIIDHYYTQDKEAWVKNFLVHLSLNTGTTTVFISTLNALQPYNPDFFHVRRAREWPKKPLEAEYIDHENYQQTPSISYADLENDVQQFAIQEMQNWSTYFQTQKPKREYQYDITTGEKPTFFFRKGQQEVLSVVVVKNTNSSTNEETPFLAYRGVNLEVSLPTGSLCAERNAIGTALADDPKLKRENILCVAVLSLGKNGPKLGPCGACREWLTKVSEVNPNFTILTFEDKECTQVFVDSIPVTYNFSKKSVDFEEQQENQSNS